MPKSQLISMGIQSKIIAMNIFLLILMTIPTVYILFQLQSLQGMVTQHQTLMVNEQEEMGEMMSPQAMSKADEMKMDSMKEMGSMKEMDHQKMDMGERLKKTNVHHQSEEELGLEHQGVIAKMEHSMGIPHSGAMKQFESVIQQSKQLTFILIIFVLAMLIVSLTLAFFLARTITKPIKILQDDALHLAQGRLDHNIDVSRSDELGNLAKSFADMRDAIHGKILDLDVLNKSYENFVPQEFLKLLEKKSIVDVKLGDYALLNMSILFSDIRSFTTLSENMGPKEIFNFLNSYLKTMEPIFKTHHGFIDKYIGDAIMALFDQTADDAVRAAIDMQRTITDYNQGRQRAGYPPIQVGIGINTGESMLGTIGGPNRMEGTVISDTVNLASRVEVLTKVYGVSTLITNHTFMSLKDPAEYQIRLIDQVQVKGKTESVVIYEVYDADPLEIREKKQASTKIFEQAWLRFQSKAFSEAKHLFQECAKQNPLDEPVQVYIKRCERELAARC